MIGYPVSVAELKARVESFKPGWTARAAAKTELARRQGNFDGVGSIWAEIKPVFMRLQGDYKCAYCERKLEAEEYGAIEQDVEHFRPKNRVGGWTPSAALREAGVNVAVHPDQNAGGYFLLAHQIFNYAAGCKPCNSTLKADRFPVAKAHVLDGEDPRKLAPQEKPFLIFPVGTWGDAPERLLAFHGLSPYAVAKTGHARHRALATIELFALGDGVSRKNLFRERAIIIQAMFPQLQVLTQPGAGPAKAARARKVIDAAVSPASPHANCGRSFKRLFERAPDQAEVIFDAAVDFVASIS